MQSQYFVLKDTTIREEGRYKGVAMYVAEISPLQIIPFDSILPCLRFKSLEEAEYYMNRLNKQHEKRFVVEKKLF